MAAALLLLLLLLLVSWLKYRRIPLSFFHTLGVVGVAGGGFIPGNGKKLGEVISSKHI